VAESLGVGLIGCGNIAHLHTASLARIALAGAPVRAVAAADPSPAAREAVTRNFPFERLHDDPYAVLSDPDVDLVYICTPTFTHRDLYLAAFDAGKHLYAEKPIAPSFPEVQELCAAAADSSVISQVGFQMRYHALLAKVAELARTGELGEPMAYLWRDDEAFPTADVDSNLSDWRSQASAAGGGVLLEHSIHGLDMLASMFGPARTVAAATRSVLGYDVEDTAALAITHDGGVVGTLATVYGGVRGREESRLEVFFRDAIVEVTWGVLVDAPEASMRIQRAGERPIAIDPADVLTDLLAQQGIEARPFFWNELASRAFVESIVGGRRASPSFDDALLAHATVEAGYRAAVSGDVVRVADVMGS